MSPEITLTAGAWTCRVEPRGATLRSLTWRGAERLATPDTLDPRLGHHGAVLAPWPGRTARGEYAYEGIWHRLEITDTLAGHAIHGLVFDVEWIVAEVSVEAVVLTTTISEPPGYPFRVVLAVCYALSADGLSCTTTWENVGSANAPFGLGFHPYFRADVDLIQLQVPAMSAIDGDATTKLPLSPRATDPLIDFAAGAAVGGRSFSRAYGALVRDADGWATVTATIADARLELAMSAEYRWVQVFTGDVPAPGLRRRGLALEPQTCPPNAFVSGHDLLHLAPGECGSATWKVRFSSPG